MPGWVLHGAPDWQLQPCSTTLTIAVSYVAAPHVRSVGRELASTVTITSAIEVVVAGAIGSRIDDSFSSIGIGGLPRDAVRVSDAAQAALWRP